MCGVGVNDFEGSVRVNGRSIPAYDAWSSMLKRCYSVKYQNNKPTYLGCSVCDEWLIFTDFKVWFDEKYREDFHLDKDILVDSNKLYSPDTCVFVPDYINTLLNARNNRKSNLPMGVCVQKPNTNSRRINESYQAFCNYTNQGEHTQLSKTFKTVEEASSWYSATKTRVVREVAQRALDCGDIGQDVFNALVSRKF